MPSIRLSAILRALGVVLGLCVVPAQAQEQPKYLRVAEASDGTVTLEVSVRALTPDDGVGPVVYLIGAVHIADEHFYRDVQSVMEACQVVLYEGVGGERDALDAETIDSPGARARTTALRQRALEIVLDASGDGAPSGSLDEANAAAPAGLAPLLLSAGIDAWDRPMLLTHAGEKPRVTSLGADGLEGGAEADADIHSGEPHARVLLAPPAPEHMVEGIQKDLAEALGLRFQLDGIDYTRPHFRNSDMTVDQIQSVLFGEPGDEHDDANNAEPRNSGEGDAQRSGAASAADGLFRTLSGESFLAKVSGFLLKIIGASESGRAVTKLALVEMLTMADELLASQPGELGKLMKVLVHDRNTVVIEDISEIRAGEPGTRSVGVFYGAGHFPDMERRLSEEFGYSCRGEIWLPAISVNPERAGVTDSQARFLREMIRQSIASQLQAMERMRDENEEDATTDSD